MTTKLIMEKERDRVAARRRKGETGCSHSSQERPTSSADVDVKVPNNTDCLFLYNVFHVAGLNSRYFG